MRYLALASDYDGTLATNGRIDAETVAAMERCLASGRKLLLVTGRELDELLGLLECPELFDYIVAENGGLLYCPTSKQVELLGEPPSERFVQTLKDEGVGPISVGRVIVATWRPHEETVLRVIRRLGLEMQVIFNKGAVMVLPSGVNKATGLATALARMKLSPHNVVAVGDGENDHALLALAEVGVSVANGVDMLRQRADLVTVGDHGAGVAELIDQLAADDLAELDHRLGRYHVLFGHRQQGEEIRVSPYGPSFLVGGTSGGGKSTFATSFLERLIENKYQVCIIDPEGDYADFELAAPLGSAQQPPDGESVVKVLENPEQSVVVNLIGVSYNERPAQFLKILGQLLQLRARTGRPHWILIDEAHHVLPAGWETSAAVLPDSLEQMAFITLEPNLLATSVLENVEMVLAAGRSPDLTLGIFAETLGLDPPPVPSAPLEKGTLMLWRRQTGEPPFVLKVAPGKLQRRRHGRKYAQGELEPDLNFHFRGPHDKLNLRAQNLSIFLQIAEGVDEETWLYHLRQGDYSRWFRDVIKDEHLATETRKLEAERKLTAADGRARIKALIEEHYALAAPAGVRFKGQGRSADEAQGNGAPAEPAAPSAADVTAR